MEIQLLLATLNLSPWILFKMFSMLLKMARKSELLEVPRWIILLQEVMPFSPFTTTINKLLLSSILLTWLVHRDSLRQELLVIDSRKPTISMPVWPTLVLLSKSWLITVSTKRMILFPIETQFLLTCCLNLLQETAKHLW